MTRILAAGGVALLLAAAPRARAVEPETATMQDEGRPGNRAVDDGVGDKEVLVPDQVFITKAMEGNLAEVKLADLALEKTQDGRVKKLAADVKRDDTGAQSELAQAATHAGIEQPKAISAEHQATELQLAQLHGEDFDRLYVRHMIREDQQDVQLYSAKSRSGDGEVSKIANRLVTVMNGHLDMAHQLDQRLASSAATTDATSATVPAR
jgi:putative membrane protein